MAELKIDAGHLLLLIAGKMQQTFNSNNFGKLLIFSIFSTISFFFFFSLFWRYNHSTERMFGCILQWTSVARDS